MHGGSQAFQGLVLGGTNGLFGHLKHLGHHIDGLFILIQKVQDEPLSVGQNAQRDGGIVQITRFQGPLWGLEGPIIEFCCSAYGPAKLPSSIDGGGPRDQRQPRAH